MEAIGDQLSPTSSLFWRSPLTTIISFSLSKLPSDCILALIASMHEPVTTCMDVYKAKIKSDGSLDKLKLIIMVRVDIKNK